MTFSNSETNRMTMSVTTAVSGIVLIVLSISGTEHLFNTLKVFSTVILVVVSIFTYWTSSWNTVCFNVIISLNNRNFLQRWLNCLHVIRIVMVSG